MQLWNPAACHGNWSTILEDESIQRFTRLGNDIELLPYSKQLQIMNLTTLGKTPPPPPAPLTYLNEMSKDDYQSDIVNRYANFCKNCNISVDNKEERSLGSYIASSNHSQIIDTSSPILKEVRANFRRNDYDFIFKYTSGYQLRRT